MGPVIERTMPADDHIKQRARAATRETLEQSTSFLAMPFNVQQSLYRDVYEANYDRLARHRAGPSTAVARSRYSTQAAYNPDDPTDPANFENRRIEQAGQLTGEFIDSIDFPGFVRDLTLAVFRGNIEVQRAQTDDFIRLLKTATASLSKYVNEVDDFAAMARLVDNEPDKFQMALPPIDDADDDDEGGRPAGPPQPTLMDKSGATIDLGDNQIRAKLLDTKIAMAQENRALLREVLLMGITRMIITKGKIEAACVFDIKAKEKMGRSALRQKEKVETEADSSGGGIELAFLGSFGGGGSSSTRETEISVSSATGKTSTDLSAKITGSISLEIATDYFKLDNFAEMYKQIAAPAAPAAAGPPAAALIPPPAAAAAPARV